MHTWKIDIYRSRHLKCKWLVCILGSQMGWTNYTLLVLLPAGGLNFLCCISQTWLLSCCGHRKGGRKERTVCHFLADVLIASTCFDNFFSPSAILTTNIRIAPDTLFWIPAWGLWWNWAEPQASSYMRMAWARNKFCCCFKFVKTT